MEKMTNTKEWKESWEKAENGAHGFFKSKNFDAKKIPEEAWQELDKMKGVYDRK